PTGDADGHTEWCNPAMRQGPVLALHEPQLEDVRPGPEWPLDRRGHAHATPRGDIGRKGDGEGDAGRLLRSADAGAQVHQMAGDEAEGGPRPPHSPAGSRPRGNGPLQRAASAGGSALRCTRTHPMSTVSTRFWSALSPGRPRASQSMCPGVRGP